MTAKAPRHPLLSSIPLVALAVAIVATACDVAGRGPLSADTSTAPARQVEEVEEVVLNAPAGEPIGDMGIQGWSWPDHGGPSFAGGTPRYPTSHVVIEVEEGRSAWNAGLRSGDVLVAVNGIDTRKLMHPFPDVRPGTRYTVRARRGAQEHEFTLEIGPARR